MITTAVLCPGPPLLVPAVSGRDPQAQRLRTAVQDAIIDLVATEPDHIVVVGVAATASAWPATARPDLRRYGPPLPPPAGEAPLSVGLGALMLDEVGYGGPLSLHTVTASTDLAAAASLARGIAGTAARVALVVVADGSACRTLKAPGYLDGRAGAYDEAVHQAVISGNLSTLDDLDPVLAGELVAPGRPALQVLAAAFADVRPHTTVHYVDAPFGVGYLVATITRAG